MTEIRNEPLRRMPNTALTIHNRLSRTFSYDLPLEKKRKMKRTRAEDERFGNFSNVLRPQVGLLRR